MTDFQNVTDLWACPAMNAQPGPRQDEPRFRKLVNRTRANRDLVRDHPEAFTRLIARQRRDLGWSQRRASRECGMSCMGFNGIERQLYLPSEHTIAAIMEGLAITRDDILAEIRAMEDEVSHAQAA